MLELKVLADGPRWISQRGKSTLFLRHHSRPPENYADYALPPSLPTSEWWSTGKAAAFALPTCPGIIEGAAGEKDSDTASFAISAQFGFALLIPADSDDHRKEFEVLVHELEQYNPELLTNNSSSP